MLPLLGVGLSYWLALLVAGANPQPAPQVQTVRLEGAQFVVVDAPPRVHAPEVVRVRVLVEAEHAEHAEAFATVVEDTLSDPDGWAAAGYEFAVVTEDADITVVLARPATTDRLCAPLHTGGTFSCGRHGRAVVNARRWLHGAATYRGRLAEYRTYVVNHEVGHLLGFDHHRCEGARRSAPVMLQQTKTLGRCRANPKPNARELAALAARPHRFGRGDAPATAPAPAFAAAVPARDVSRAEP
ncbi:MAG: DUF3152 domain-containing protein [Nannocystaceae bacterium]|nr:DUF3152 domain-containing protein [Nannocystaceae bacterium]